MSPVFGLAECSVGLAFTTPGDAWRMDTLDRETFTTTGEAVDADPQDPAPLKIVGCGQVIPGHDVRVVDGAGFEAPDRQEGMLQFRGPSATTGYYRNPEATKALFAGGGWLNTGDRAYLSDGMIYITGREKDIIIRGGRNISPYELEEAVGDLPGIRRGCVAVFGSLDRASGTERVVVLAETREQDATLHEALKKQINQLAMSLIAAPADDIVLAPPATVPKTSSGKIRRVAAREYYERGPESVRPQAVWLQFVRLVLAGVAPQMRRGWRTARSMLFGLRGWLVFSFLFPIPILFAAIAPGAPAWRITGRLARLFFRLAGIPLVVRGLEHLPAGPCVIAVNHTSYLDGAALMAALAERPFAFVAKRELRDNFISRLFITGIGAEFVERFEVQKSVEHAGELAAAAQRGVSLIVFPEGTFRRQPGLMAFRAGAFQVAAQAGIPAVPVAIRGARSVLRDGTWYLRRGAVAVSFAPPVQPEGNDWNATLKLRDQVRAEILKRCGEPDLS